MATNPILPFGSLKVMTATKKQINIMKTTSTNPWKPCKQQVKGLNLAQHLDWRFNLCFFCPAGLNCNTLAAWRVEKIIPGTSTNCSDTSAAKTVAAFAAHIHVYTGSSHSRFPEMNSSEKEITVIEEAFNS